MPLEKLFLYFGYPPKMASSVAQLAVRWARADKGEVCITTHVRYRFEPCQRSIEP